MLNISIIISIRFLATLPALAESAPTQPHNQATFMNLLANLRAPNCFMNLSPFNFPSKAAASIRDLGVLFSAGEKIDRSLMR